MKMDEIVIKIYNMPTLRMDLAEKWIKEYAMNVATEAYIRGYEDKYQERKMNAFVSLSEMDTDNYN
jgi:hypothetical protein